MERPTLPDVPVASEEVKALEGQIRECYGRAAYVHKTHEKCADLYHGRLRKLKLTQILLSAITTGSLIVTLLGKNQISTVIAAVTSTLLLAINTYTKENDLGELAQKHVNAAGDLWNVRESYLSLLTDLTSQAIPPEKIREKRNELQEMLKNVYQSAPRTTPKAYSAAQAALQINEELTFSEEEIDNMLPPFLRRARIPKAEDVS